MTATVGFGRVNETFNFRCWQIHYVISYPFVVLARQRKRTLLRMQEPSRAYQYRDTFTRQYATQLQRIHSSKVRDC